MLKKIFNMQLKTEEFVDMSSYPLLYRDLFDVRYARIGSTRCLLIRPNREVRLSMLVKAVPKFEADFNLPALVYAPWFSGYQRLRLSEEGIAWAVSEGNLSIPFIGLILSKEKPGSSNAPAALSANAQRTLFHIADESWAGMSTSQIASELDMSLSSAVSYLKEIEAVMPDLVQTSGRRRYIPVKPPAISWELITLFGPYLSSPVAKVKYLKGKGLDKSLVDAGCKYSGMTALSAQSMIADNHHVTLACSRRNKKVSEIVEKAIEVTALDDFDVALEIWSYEPDSGESPYVDSWSLYLSLQDEAESDPRVSSALDELKKGA